MSKKTILVVDDEEIIRDFLGEVLDEDYSVSTASDGDEAIELLKQRSYDLVITDMKMPKVSGEELVKFCKSRNPAYKVIVISGYLGFYAVKAGSLDGPNAILSKPFSIKQLRDAVSAAMAL